MPFDNLKKKYFGKKRKKKSEKRLKVNEKILDAILHKYYEENLKVSEILDWTYENFQIKLSRTTFYRYIDLVNPRDSKNL